MSLAFLFCLPLILTRSFYYLSLFLFIAQPPKDNSTAQAYYAALAGGRDEAGGEPPDAPPSGEDAVPPSPPADTNLTAPTPPEASRAQAALVADKRVCCFHSTCGRSHVRPSGEAGQRADEEAGYGRGRTRIGLWPRDGRMRTDGACQMDRGAYSS